MLRRSNAAKQTSGSKVHRRVAIARDKGMRFAGDAVISMRPNDDAIREVFLDSGVLASDAGNVHVNMATASVWTARELAARHAEHGIGRRIGAEHPQGRHRSVPWERHQDRRQPGPEGISEAAAWCGRTDCRRRKCSTSSPRLRLLRLRRHGQAAIRASRLRSRPRAQGCPPWQQAKRSAFRCRSRAFCAIASSMPSPTATPKRTGRPLREMRPAGQD
jgi:hypothetical protein